MEAGAAGARETCRARRVCRGGCDHPLQMLTCRLALFALPPPHRDAVSALEVIKPNAYKLLKDGIDGAKALQRAVIK
jgi:hypothetical protein